MLIPNSMQHIPHWEADIRSVSQFSFLLRNPKIRHRIHNSPLLSSILNHVNLWETSASHDSEDNVFLGCDAVRIHRLIFGETCRLHLQEGESMFLWNVGFYLQILWSHSLEEHCCVIPVLLFIFSEQIVYTYRISACMLYVQPIQFFLIWSPL
jgi:hypothetical protein